MQNYKVHPSVVIDEGAHIGDNSTIWHFTHICAGAHIGANTVIGQGCYIANVRIGRGVRIQNNVSIFDAVTLEDDVFCGPSCVFSNVINPRSHRSRKSEYRPTLVRKGASIGANATIVCGTTIGEHAFIGAGAVVVHDVLPHAVMAGVPAKRIAWMCECGEGLKAHNELWRCHVCNRDFSLHDET